MALSFDVLMNGRQAQREARDLSKSLDEVADSMDDLGADGGDAGEKLERTFRDMVKDAGKAERAAKDAAGAVDKIGDSSRRVGDDAGKGFGRAKEASGTFKDEALSNLSEVASSFDGSMESVGDLVQGTVGGVTADLGLIGLAAAPVAASVGLITDAFVKAQEATDEAKQSAYEYGLTVAGAGAYADTASRIRDLTGSIEGLKQVQDIAAISGMNQKEVIAALATGDGLPALTQAFQDGANSTDIATTRALELQGVLDGTAEGFRLSATGADLQAEALYNLALASGTATGEVDALGREVVRLPDGKEIAIDAKTQTAHEAIDRVEERQIADKETTVRVRVDDYDWRVWQPGVKYSRVEAINPFRTVPSSGRDWQ